VKITRQVHVLSKAAIFILTAVLFTTCADNNTFKEGDFFFLVNKGAEMPVVVRGKTSAGVFIVFLHGGPGGTALQKVGLPAFNELEKDYATVFWDQRGSGSSQGNSTKDLLTLPQFVEDLDKLIDVVRVKYDSPRIFLMGHSWGGCLGTSYLTDRVRQTKIRGWIEVDGAHDNPKADSLSLDWMEAYASNKLSVNQDSEFWSYALNWYHKNPNFTSDQLEHYAFVEKANGYVHDPTVKRTPASFPGYSTDYIFHSPADIGMTLTNYNTVIRNFIISDIDLTAEMKKISLPSLIVWGEFDGIIPVPMATEAFDALGTASVSKRITILHNSGHVGFYEEPEVFAASVRAFMETYK
jgi:pimeloyl-ACP methyl ester carboxylesterase